VFTKRELLQLWKKYEFRPKKKLGQNFLIDKNVKDKIINFIDPCGEDNILEIGAGFAELTLDMASRSRRVVALEKDKRIIHILEKEGIAKMENMRFINEDFLEYEHISRFDKIIGNLPYYITTPIIERFISLRSQRIKGIYIMVQSEYADRMMAVPSCKDYSSLSLFVQFYTSCRKAFKVKRDCFFPRPEVDSVFLKVKFYDKPKVSVRNVELLFRIIRRAFQGRRKMIVNSLSGEKGIGIDKSKFIDILKNNRLDICARPEDLSLEEYGAISDELDRSRLK